MLYTIMCLWTNATERLYGPCIAARAGCLSQMGYLFVLLLSGMGSQSCLERGLERGRSPKLLAAHTYLYLPLPLGTGAPLLVVFLSL